MNVKETILLVDDDKILLEIGRDLLEKQGYNIFTAENGETALAVSKVQEGRIDLAILDMNMPGMSGEECMEELHKIDSDLKIIVSSGYSDRQRMKRLLECGASACVSKPYKFKKMLDTARELLKNN